MTGVMCAMAKSRLAEVPPGDVHLGAYDIQSFNFKPPVTAQIKFDPDGWVRGFQWPGGTFAIERWLLAGAAGDYEIMATQTGGGPVDGAALDVWLPLSSTVAWSVSGSFPTPASASLELAIRDAATSMVLAAGTADLWSEVTS